MNSLPREASRCLTGRIALVTGSATGIGRETVLALARAGANVVVNYSRSEADAKKTHQEAEALGASAILCRANVADEVSVQAMIDHTIEVFGRLDILVNNAGTTQFVPFTQLDDLTDDLWDHIFGVNVKGAFYCTRAAVPHLRQHDSGLVVNVASVAAFTGRGSSIPYAASKGALVTLTKSLAVALAPGIRVNGVAPGVVKTRWVAGHQDHVERLGRDTLLGRPAGADDVANVIDGFATHSTFLTGEVIVVDGGRLLR